MSLIFNNFRGCRAVLLDFGGTLDSDGEHWLDRFYGLYDQAGINIPRPEIKAAFYQADALCHGRVTGWGLRPLMRHHVHLQFQSLNLRSPDKERELADLFCAKSESYLRRNAQILDRIKDRYRLGVISNFYGNVAALCQEAGLDANLEVILDSMQVGLSKPQPEIFEMALNKLQLSPDRVIFVGDSYDRDMIPARELGMKTVWLKGPNPRVPENAGPVAAQVSSLLELEALLP
ncbi:MAG: HAD family hydrolase [Deltaproteobacteria bacterium]|nr:HAD family hydrolase [Deltaproteobacteria bacterium]